MKIRKNKKPSELRDIKKKIKNAESKERLSFTEILNVAKEEKKKQELEKILEKINKKGQDLIDNRTVENLLSYKKMIKNFIEDAVDFGLTVNAKRGYGARGRTKILRTINEIDKELVKITDIIINQEKRGVSLLKKVGKMEGLLVDIFI